MSTTARALWITGPGQAELRTEQLGEPTDDQVGVRALYSGISRGTESLVFRGGVPPSQYEAMRAPFQDGAFPAPIKYGYSNVGIVEHGPSSLAGRVVFCLYPHQDRYIVSADAVVPLPAELPPERAVLTANMETAVNGVWDADPQVGDRVAVIGAGSVGCLVAYLVAQIPGTSVELIDIDPGKAAIAEALEVSFRNPDDAAGDVDLVIHASGAPGGLTTALMLAGFEATVLEMSWFGDRSVSVPLGEAFHSRRLTIRSSQVGSLPASRLARWTHRRRVELALLLLADDPRLDQLIAHEADFDDLPSNLASILDGSLGDGVYHRVRY